MRAGVNGVLIEVVLATISVDAKGSDGQALWGDCLTTVGGVTVAGPADDGTSRKTVSKGEAIAEELIDITRKSDTGS